MASRACVVWRSAIASRARRVPCTAFGLAFALTLLAALSAPAFAQVARPTVGSREYKLLLSPARFNTRSIGFHAYWDVVRGAAGSLGVPLSEARGAWKESRREVLFLDTPAGDLAARGLILRRRTDYKGTSLAGDYELTLKYRQPDLDTAASGDVRASEGLASQIVLEEETLLHPSEVGSLRRNFSLADKVKALRRPLAGSIGAHSAVFPPLARLGLDPQAPLTVVGDARIDEVKVTPGTVDLGGVPAEVTISVWHERRSGAAVVAELSYSYDVTPSTPATALARGDALFTRLQLDAPDWLYLGSTKTAAVYAAASSSGTVDLAAPDAGIQAAVDNPSAAGAREEAAHSVARNWPVVVARLFVAGALAALVAFRPWQRLLPRAARIESTLAVTIVGTCLGGTVLIALVGEGPAIAFGLVGLGSVLGFRSNISRRRDAALMFVSIVLGMACGAGMLALGAVVAAVTALLATCIDLASPGSRGRAVLSLDWRGAPPWPEVAQAVPTLRVLELTLSRDGSRTEALLQVDTHPAHTGIPALLDHLRRHGVRRIRHISLSS